MKQCGIKEYKPNLTFNMSPYTNTILEKEIIAKIQSFLDLRYKYSKEWNLLYSTFEHGFSYKTFISSFTNKNKPFILVIKTDNKYSSIIGVYFEENIHLDLKPYGKRKIILFNAENILTLNQKDIKIICTEQYLAFGCKNGQYGILIQNTLRRGQQSVFKEQCTSFNIKYMELWNIIE